MFFQYLQPYKTLKIGPVEELDGLNMIITIVVSKSENVVMKVPTAKLYAIYMKTCINNNLKI